MKVTVIGAGNVGATAAECVARKDMVHEVVMVDIQEGMPQGKALDMMESAPIHGFDTRIIGTNEYDATEDTDVCIITAGLPRKPGMSRDDLLAKNAEIVGSVTRQFAEGSPDAKLIIVSNPLDVMTYVAFEESGFDDHHVMGMAGVLDTARYRAFLAMELGCSVRDIQALLMGGHGDTMVPLPRYTTVGGIPITELLDDDTIEGIVERTKGGGGEIVNLMGTSAWYAPGAAAAEMAEAAGKDHRDYLLELLGPARQIDPSQFGDSWNYGEDPSEYVIDIGRMRGVIEKATQEAGWGRQLPQGRGMGLAFHHSFQSYTAIVLEVEVDDGEARVDEVVYLLDTLAVGRLGREQRHLLGVDLIVVRFPEVRFERQGIDLDAVG